MNDGIKRALRRLTTAYLAWCDALAEDPVNRYKVSRLRLKYINACENVFELTRDKGNIKSEVECEQELKMLGYCLSYFKIDEHDAQTQLIQSKQVESTMMILHEYVEKLEISEQNGVDKLVRFAYKFK